MNARPLPLSADTSTSHWAGDATSVRSFLRPLQPLLDCPGALEVCVNGPGEAWLETATQGWQRHPIPELSHAHTMALAMAVATYADQHISAERPLLVATLPDGQRLQLAIPPAVAHGRVAITVRLPSPHTKRLETFEREGLFSRLCAQASDPSPAQPPAHPPVRAAVGTSPTAPAPQDELNRLLAGGDVVGFLRTAVHQRLTVVLSGRTGSGKTTLMKGLAEEIPRDERLVTIEDTAELTLPHHPNAVHLFYGRGLSAGALLHASLRMRPDRIFLAEVRGPECFDFLRMAASGHPGSLTSLHAGSCAQALDQMALMIRESGAGGGLILPEIQRLVRSVVDVVVQCDRDAHGRFVSDIHLERRT